MTVVYNRVALIGLGLIASSMFWSIRRGNLAQEVVGFAKSEKTRDTAKSIGLCDYVFNNLNLWTLKNLYPKNKMAAKN